MALVRVISFDNKTPANGSYDLHDAGLTNCFEVPVWFSFSYWVSTSAILAVGAFSLDVQYEDPTGQTRIINGSPISLQDNTAFFASPVVQAQRLNGGSLFEVISTLAGLAATSKVAGRIMFDGFTEEDASIYDWT